jgi:anti-sigma B factor antagonist
MRGIQPDARPPCTRTNVCLRLRAAGQAQGVAVRSDIEVSRIGAATVVAFDGDADLEGVDPLRRALRDVVALSEGGVVVDLRDTRFIDSCGMSTLLNTVRRLTRQGRRLAVVADQDAIVRPLELTGLASTLRLHRRLGDALDAV